MLRAPWNNVLQPAVDTARQPLLTASVAAGIRRMQWRFMSSDAHSVIPSFLRYTFQGKDRYNASKVAKNYNKDFERRYVTC